MRLSAGACSSMYTCICTCIHVPTCVHVYIHICICTCIHVSTCIECRVFESHPMQLIFLWKSDCLGCAVLLCLVCLFDLACFFLPSFSSLIKNMYAYVHEYMHMYMYTCICTCIHVYTYMHVYMYTCICIYIYAYVHVCVCVPVGVGVTIQSQYIYNNIIMIANSNLIS